MLKPAPVPVPESDPDPDPDEDPVESTDEGDPPPPPPHEKRTKNKIIKNDDPKFFITFPLSCKLIILLNLEFANFFNMILNVD